MNINYQYLSPEQLKMIALCLVPVNSVFLWMCCIPKPSSATTAYFGLLKQGLHWHSQYAWCTQMRQNMPKCPSLSQPCSVQNKTKLKNNSNQMLNRMYLYINTHTTDHVYVALTILNRLSSPQILSHAPWITTLLSPTYSLSTPMNISGFISLSRPSSSMGLDLILPSEAPFAQHRTHYMAVGIFAGCAVTCMHACVTQCVPVFETFLCSLNHFHFLSIS